MIRKKTYTLKKKEKELKQNIIQLMINKGIYEDVDEFLINQLLFNLHLADDATSDIIQRGVSVNVRSDDTKEPYYQQNPSVSIYQQAIKQVITISTKLGITAQERQKLKLINKKENSLNFLND